MKSITIPAYFIYGRLRISFGYLGKSNPIYLLIRQVIGFFYYIVILNPIIFNIPKLLLTTPKTHFILQGWYGNTYKSTGVDIVELLSQPAENINNLSYKKLSESQNLDKLFRKENEFKIKGWYGNTYESTGVDNKVPYQPEDKNLTLTYNRVRGIWLEGWYGDTFKSTGVDNEVADQPLCRYIILDIRNYE